MTMTKKTEQLRECDQATNKILDLADEAERRMAVAMHRACKGYVILADPLAVRGNLRDAAKAINEALAILAATAWPTSDDYDAWECSRNILL
jgi:hypothetical protein